MRTSLHDHSGGYIAWKGEKQGIVRICYCLTR